MKPLTIETFKPDMIKVINYEWKKAGEIKYTSVKFKYAGGGMPPLRIDGCFRLFGFKTPRGDIYSQSIRCDEKNESFFDKLCDAVARESCRLVHKVNRKRLKPDDFDLVKENKSGRLVYAKIYCKKSGKVRCRVSLGSTKNTIDINGLVDENFDGSCILKLYHAYLGATKSINLSVEEIFVREMPTVESYFGKLDAKSEEDE